MTLLAVGVLAYVAGLLTPLAAAWWLMRHWLHH